MPYIGVKGMNIFYEYTNGDSVPIVLIHGAGGSSQRWSKQLSDLQNQLILIAPDLPGHGRSEGDLSLTISLMAQFLNDFIEALALKKFILVGHSMGGAIAQEYALSYPNKLKGLILIGTGARLKVSRNVLDSLSSGQFPFENVNHLYSSTTSDDRKAKEMGELKEIPTKVFWADFHACNSFDRTADIEKIQVPCLIMVGDEDVMTPIKYSRFLEGKINNAHLKIIKAAGHMCMEEKADEVNKEILNFLGVGA